MDDSLELEEIPDEVLERAATATQQAVTWAYCTNGWQSCEWPQVSRLPRFE